MISACASTPQAAPSAPESRPGKVLQRYATLPKLSIGSYNPTRGGFESLRGSGETGLKKHLSLFFPGTTYHFTGFLSKTFFQSINVFLIGVAFSDTTPIKPLGATEQANLVNFAKGGGTVIIFADNTDFQTADDSLLSPFGVSSTGKLTGSQTAAFVNTPNPIMNGPAGKAAQIDSYYPGWLSSLGSSTAVADLNANGEPVVSYLPAGALGSSSGAVVFFSDSSLMVDGIRTNNDRIAIFNALALTK
ncbi:MAG TPA: hypothetical protein VGZ02_10810 [Candidatus Baltobacteraceae bacterium]|nr:hypothetical protein [Candidatus Baltobacteraceae bacterium]